MGKKIKVSDWINKLGLDHRGQYIAAAYADCLPDNVDIAGHGTCYGEGRMLSFMLPYPIEARSLQSYLQIIGKYNGFTPELAAKLVIELFGGESIVFVAREGSPCLYVRPSKKYLNLESLKNVKSPLPDELGFDLDKNMFRLWWD